MLVKKGVLIPLKKYDNCFLARTDPKDVARWALESRGWWVDSGVYLQHFATQHFTIRQSTVLDEQSLDLPFIFDLHKLLNRMQVNVLPTL